VLLFLAIPCGVMGFMLFKHDQAKQLETEHRQSQPDPY
jgi:hypothetical protein